MKPVVYLRESTNPEKKFMVTIFNGRKKTLHFGDSEYEDYTIHKDPERLKKYDSRHTSRENWKKSGLHSAGFWSKWILWNQPSLNKSITHTEKKFNIIIKKGDPPSSI